MAKNVCRVVVGIVLSEKLITIYVKFVKNPEILLNSPDIISTGRISLSKPGQAKAEIRILVT